MFAVLDSLFLLLGALAGYCHASLVESWSHDTLQHARRSTREGCGVYPLVGRWIQKAWHSHTAVHHGLSYRPYHVTQFASARQAQRAADYVNEHRLDPGNDFGLSVSRFGALRFLLPFMPLSILVALLAPTSVALPFVLMSPTSLLLSAYVHPYMHLSFAEGQARAPYLIRQLLRTRMGKRMWARHFLHHRRPKVCFNLMLPIGDWLRGVHMRPSARDLAEVHRASGQAVGRKAVG